MSRRLLAGLVIVAVLLGTGLWAQVGTGSGTATGVFNTVYLSGADIAFHVESWDHSTPVGRWVVKNPKNGLWVEPLASTIPRPASR